MTWKYNEHREGNITLPSRGDKKMDTWMKSNGAVETMPGKQGQAIGLGLFLYGDYVGITKTVEDGRNCYCLPLMSIWDLIADALYRFSGQRTYMEHQNTLECRLPFSEACSSAYSLGCVIRD